MMLYLLDGELPSATAAVARELAVSLVCSLGMQGLWADGPPIIGLVRGNQVQTLQPIPDNAQVWAAEISKLLAAHAASPQIHTPGVTSLINLPAHLAQAPRITFLTALGSTSAHEAALRPVLEALELRQQHLEMLIVGEETYTVPNEFIILQSSFDSVSYTHLTLPTILLV